MLLLAVGIAACSGDDGSPAPGDDDPPRLINRSPSLSVTTSGLTVDERQSITIDASASSDIEDDPLTFSISLEDTPFAELSDDSEAPIWTVSTHEVDADTRFSARVTASDGSNTVELELRFQILNYDRTPISGVWAPSTAQYQVPAGGIARLSDLRHNDGYKILHVLHRSATGALSVLEFDFLNSLFASPTQLQLTASSVGDEVLVADRFRYNGDAGFVLWSRNAQSVIAFQRDSLQSLSDAGSITLPGLCSVRPGMPVIDGDIRTDPDLMLGTENGLWAWLNEGGTIDTRDISGNFSELRLWEITGDYCHGEPNGLYYDSIRQELHTGTQVTLDDAFLPGVLPVETPTGLSLVDIGYGTSQNRDHFIALLFAGETHDAPHQLSVLHPANPLEYYQADITLPSGIPSKLVMESFDTHYVRNDGPNFHEADTDILITVPETPYAYLIKTDFSTEDGLILHPIEYVEVGFGVHEAEMIITDDSERRSLITNDGSMLNLHQNTLFAGSMVVPPR